MTRRRLGCIAAIFTAIMGCQSSEAPADESTLQLDDAELQELDQLSAPWHAMIAAAPEEVEAARAQFDAQLTDTDATLLTNLTIDVMNILDGAMPLEGWEPSAETVDLLRRYSEVPYLGAMSLPVSQSSELRLESFARLQSALERAIKFDCRMPCASQVLLGAITFDETLGKGVVALTAGQVEVGGPVTIEDAARAYQLAAFLLEVRTRHRSNLDACKTYQATPACACKEPDPDPDDPNVGGCAPRPKKIHMSCGSGPGMNNGCAGGVRG
jgi:hypothetical protein